MSSSRGIYDEACYRHDLRQSTGTGRYMLNTPHRACALCLPASPRVRERSTRLGHHRVVDVESRLMRLGRPLSECHEHDDGPDGVGASATTPSVFSEGCGAAPTPTCEDTRLSDPPCGRRGTENGYNRWTWLVGGDPQCNAIQPFERINSQRIIAKDTFRPCLPKPLPSSNAVGGASSAPGGVIAADAALSHPAWEPPVARPPEWSAVSNHAASRNGCPRTSS